jgi:hypothetical protein
MGPHDRDPGECHRDEIRPDTPLRLAAAARLAFPDGSMTASGLRAEARRGRLEIERIAGKDYTTLAALQKMRLACRVPTKALGCGSNPMSAMAPGSSSATPHGSCVTDHVRSARAALEMTARGLSGRSPITSSKNTKSRESAAVILLKS